MAELSVSAALSRVVAAVGGVTRPGQEALAEAIGEAIAQRRHVLAQAGTGSGKSFAYLVPALLSGQKVVVVTATKALQDQLWRKDIPVVVRELGREGNVAMLKGRSNYLCYALLDAATSEQSLFVSRPSTSFPDDVAALERWASATTTGDEADLDVAVAPGSWRALTCGPGECPGANRCHRGSDCFAERARARAQDADLLVVNTSLYCAHIASGGFVLPPHDLVIMDEAHELPEVATRAFGLELSGGRLRFLAGRARTLLGAGAGDSLARAADRLGQILDAGRGREVQVDPTAGELAQALVQTGEALAAVLAAARDGDANDAEATSRLQLVQMVTSALDDVRRLGAPLAGDVVWMGGAPVALHSAPVDVGDRLGSALFDRTPVICVSATLGAGSRFEPFARAIGLDPGAEVTPEADDDPGLAYSAERFESPFDYRTNGRLYVAAHLPDPRSTEWLAAAGAELRTLVEAAGGRTLVLSTSHAGARACAEALGSVKDITVLAQGDGPKAALIEAFRAEPSAVLVATRGFWQGVDVPGDTCVLVVIDKLPFARPDDPLEIARRTRVEAAGGNAFRDVDLPRAALTLAQGAGRLLRTSSDRGVVAVLDPRLATARYRSELLRALPPFQRTITQSDVVDFLRVAVSVSDPV